MKYVRRSEQGFTLMEVIISIAILSMISVFILQMFLISKTVNSNAQNIDYTTSIAITTMDSIKRLSVLEDYKTNECFINSDIEEVENGISFSNYYDSKFNRVSKTEEPAFLINVKLEEDSLLNLKQEFETGKMYNVIVSVIELSNSSEQSQLLQFSSKKYFSNAVASNGQER